jgi:hypothetical protein
MESGEGDERIVVESAKGWIVPGIARALGLLLFAAGIAAVYYPFYDGWFSRPGYRHEAVGFILAMAIISGFGLALRAMASRRTWEIDRVGIRLIGPYDRDRMLLWREVDHIRWESHVIRFYGPKARIDLPIGLLRLDRRPSLESKIREVLTAEFEFPKRDDSWRGLGITFFKLAIALAALYGSMLLIPVGLALWQVKIVGWIRAHERIRRLMIWDIQLTEMVVLLITLVAMLVALLGPFAALLEVLFWKETRDRRIRRKTHDPTRGDLPSGTNGASDPHRGV